MRLLRFIIRVICLVALNLAVAAAFAAPRNSPSPATATEAAPRVQGSVDANTRVVLHGNTHPLIQSGTDMGEVDSSLPAGRMLLLLQRSPEQESALADFIQAAHTPGSPSFHQWLKPQEFGRLYGPADSDIAAVTAWLQSHGLTVNQVHAGRLAIEFTGTAGQVNEAFQTKIHRYQVNGEIHLANATDPSVPAALAPVIIGLAPLNDFHPQPRLQVMGRAQFNPKTHQATPKWTYPQGGGVVFVMAPGDFAMQYDINSVYSAGITGSGQSIAIISESNVDLSLVAAYLNLFGLSGLLPTVIVDGVDPGQNSAAVEAYLDIEIAGSVAPGATVLLYTSNGTALSNGLALAAMRAVEDDQAGIISVSYGECESALGQSGNAFWSALWQQAAAQGQTVFVSSGDGGSASCDNFDAQQVAYSGLAVNGIASTPYNVAVGGTDFFYSSYNTPSAIAAQLNSYWSTTSTTTPTVSLKQPIPEQAWNDFFGFNMYDSGNPNNQPSEMIVASGGGASSAALYPSGIATGYAKPAWQTGTGVPTDHVRDLPDLSLFAANGYNYSFYPICASPGDCSGANLTSSSTVVITGVGGTSASSPAMAGIQALINQSTGVWAGQANFIYYPLATRHPAAFHDVTIGGNQVLCYPGTANCVAGSSISNSNGYYVENGYSTGTGYDLATGLGSVDVASMIANWNSVSFTPTTVTLNVSPTTLVHGTTATINGAVTRSSGSGTPTGSVSLDSNNGISHSAAIDDIALSTGSYYASVDNLPGGIYQLTAVYGGDGTFGAGKSAPVTVTVTPENNTLATTGWAWNPFDLYLYPLSAGITVPYGAQISLDAQPISANATIANEPTPATGTVTFTDRLGSATVTATQPLNAAGVAEWSTGVFAPGNHTVSESYSGDPSYNPSAALSAASFIVIPGSTSLTVKPLVSSVAAGASVTVDVILNTGYLSLYGTLPTGNVIVTLGTQSIAAPWQPYGATGNASLEAVVTFSNVPAGILPLIAYYQGDSNWLGSAANGGTVISLASKFTPAVVLNTSLATPSPSQNFTLTATVTGVSGKPNPTGTVAFLSDGQSFEAFVNLNSGVAAIVIPGYATANGTNIFTAVYQGDGNYNAAASNAVNVTVSQADFSLTTQNAELTISPSGSGISTLALAPINGFSNTVTISASAPAGITVTPAAASLALSAPATDVLTLNVAASSASEIYPLPNTPGTFISSYPLGHYPEGTTIDSIGNVWITNHTDSTVMEYSPNGVLLHTYSTDTYGASLIAIDHDGNIWLAQIHNNIVTKMSSSGTILGTYTTGQTSANPGPLSMVIDAHNNVWMVVLNTVNPGAGVLVELSSTGTILNTIALPGIGAGGLAIDSGGNIWVSYEGSNILTEVSPMGNIIQNINVAAKSGGSNGTFRFDSSGNIWIADTFGGSKSIIVLTPTGAVLQTITLGYIPTGLSFDPLGNVWVSCTITDDANGYILELSHSGEILYTYTSPYSNSSPFAPLINNDGTVWTTFNTVNYTVNNGYVIRLAGSTTTGTSTPFVTDLPITITASGGGHIHTAQILVRVLAVAAPVFSPAAGTFSSTQQVTLTDATDNTAIFYTTDGTTPTASSTMYTGAITVSASETIQAIAIVSGYASSSVTSGTYTIGTPFFGCPSGSGSCVDNFTGSAGTALPTYNSRWVLAAGTNSISTTGSNSAQVSGTASAVYYYSASSSDISQITLAPSSTTIGYEKLACVRVSSGNGGYCLGLSAVSSGNYTACYVMKNFRYLGYGNCSAMAATANHTLALVASGTSTVTLTIYVDGVSKGTVTDSSSPYTVAGSGFGLQGDGTPSDSAVNEWQDYSGGFPAATPTFSPIAGIYPSAQTVSILDTTPSATIYYTTNGTAPTTSSTLYSTPITVSATETLEALATAPGYLQSGVGSATYTISATLYGCPSGSGSCFDYFAGTSATLLPTYNSRWVLAAGTNSISTTGSNSAQVSGTASAVYYYSASSSDISQITLAPSSTTIGYEKLACVRVSSGNGGYCLGLSAVSSGNYTACYVMKNFRYLGYGNCSAMAATTSHTLTLVASGTSTVSLTIYVDGVSKGTITDSSSPYTVAGSGFGLQGDGTPADSTVNEWQDYSGSSPTASISPSPKRNVGSIQQERPTY